MPILAYITKRLEDDQRPASQGSLAIDAHFLLQGAGLTVLRAPSESLDVQFPSDGFTAASETPESSIPVEFTAALASECLELQRSCRQSIFISAGGSSLSAVLCTLRQLISAAASSPSPVLTTALQTRRSRTGKQSGKHSRRRSGSFTSLGRHFHLLHAPLHEDAAEDQQASADEQQPSLPGMLQSRGWQSSAEWGITQFLASLGCCTVRTSSFDLDDLDKVDGAAAAAPARQAVQELPLSVPAAGCIRSKSVPDMADLSEEPLLSSRSSPEMRSSLWACQSESVPMMSPKAGQLSACNHAMQHCTADCVSTHIDMAATADSDDIFSTAQDLITPPALEDAEAEQAKPLSRQASLNRSDSAMQQLDLADAPPIVKSADFSQPSLHGGVVCAVADLTTAAGLKQLLLQHVSPEVASMVRFQIGHPVKLLLAAGTSSYDHVMIEHQQEPGDAQDTSAALIGSAIQATRSAGRVVYTSSGLLPAQNDKAVRRALSQHPDARAMQLNPDHHSDLADQETVGTSLHGMLRRQQRTEMGFLLKQPAEYVPPRQYLSITQKM